MLGECLSSQRGIRPFVGVGLGAGVDIVGGGTRFSELPGPAPTRLLLGDRGGSGAEHVGERIEHGWLNRDRHHLLRFRSLLLLLLLLFCSTCLLQRCRAWWGVSRRSRRRCLARARARIRGSG